MDWTAIAVGAIPSLVSVLVLLIQIFRDRKKDEALVQKTRAETVVEEATAADTITDAAEKIVSRYERIIERMERQHAREVDNLVKELETLRRLVGRHKSF